MKISTRILMVSILMGVVFWVVDAVVDGLFFEMHRQAVIANDSYWWHEFYMRTIFSVSVIIFGIVVSILIKRQKNVESKLKESLRFQQSLIDAIPLPVFYKDENLIYTGCNNSFADFLGKPVEAIVGKTVYDLAPKALADTYHEKDMELLRQPGVQIYHYTVSSKISGQRDVVFNKATFFRSNGEVGGLIGAVLDITDAKRAAKEKDLLIGQLQEALNKVKVLSGFIPICASCKKIRDDKGFWNNLENYISSHSDAVFSHGICPDCSQRLYPELADKLVATASK